MDAGESWAPVTNYFNQIGEKSGNVELEVQEKPLVQLFTSDQVPDVQVIQFTAGAKPITKKEKWVELRDCDGTAGEVKLLPENANATVATCKQRPGVDDSGKAQAAAAALDSMTPKPEK